MSINVNLIEVNRFTMFAYVQLITNIPGANFINILCSAFTLADTESVKKTDNLAVFFALLGSACLVES